METRGKGKGFRDLSGKRHTRRFRNWLYSAEMLEIVPGLAGKCAVRRNIPAVRFGINLFAVSGIEPKVDVQHLTRHPPAFRPCATAQKVHTTLSCEGNQWGRRRCARYLMARRFKRKKLTTLP